MDLNKISQILTAQSMLSYQIREAVAADCRAVYHCIVELEAVSLDRFVFGEIFLENTGHPDHCYLVAESPADGIIGFISLHSQLMLHHAGRVAEIQECFVKSAFRGQGIGTSLLEKGLEAMAARQCLLVEVTAQIMRNSAHAFYAAAGFSFTHKKFVKAIA